MLLNIEKRTGAESQGRFGRDGDVCRLGTYPLFRRRATVRRGPLQKGVGRHAPHFLEPFSPPAQYIAAQRPEATLGHPFARKLWSPKVSHTLIPRFLDDVDDRSVVRGYPNLLLLEFWYFRDTPDDETVNKQGAQILPIS